MLHTIDPPDGYLNGTEAAHVVFVHGLVGHYKGTWSAVETGEAPSWLSWFNDAGDGLKVAIHSLEYDADPRSARRTIEEAATLALLELCAHPVGIGNQPVIFVAHSLGGLMVKHMLVRARRSGSPLESALLSRVAGVVFIATPHAPPTLASIAKTMESVVGKIINVALGVPLSSFKVLPPIIRDLSDENALHRLQTDYRNLADTRRIQHLNFSEGKPLKGVGIVVDHICADPQVPYGEPQRMVEHDHMSICKPTHVRDQVFSLTKSFVQRVARGRRPEAFALGGEALPVAYEAAHGRSDVLNYLWSAWLAGTPRIICLTGPPGQGKTTLVDSFLRRHRENSWSGVARAFRFSFAGQGQTHSGDAQADLDRFWRKIAHEFDCIAQLDDKRDLARALRNRMHQLALRDGRSLIVLDGLEVHQGMPGPMKGRAVVANSDLRAFLEEFRDDFPGLLLITSQFKLAGMSESANGIEQRELYGLEGDAGRLMLADQGIADPDVVSEAIAQSNGNPLCMLLVASQLAGGGSVEPVLEDEESLRRRMDQFAAQAKARVLSDRGEESLEADIIRAMILIGGRASRSQIIAALPSHWSVRPRFGADLTNAVKSLSALKVLTEQGRKALASAEDAEHLHMIPSVFAALRKSFDLNERWAREAHLRLAEHYLAVEAKAKGREKDGAEAIELLFRAASHQLKGGDAEKALADTYAHRIQGQRRRLRGSYNNTVGSELGFLALFFRGDSSEYRRWSELSPAFNFAPENSLRVFQEAHYALRAAGRIKEALQAGHAWRSHAAFGMSRRRLEYDTDWIETLLIAGEVKEAHKLAFELQQRAQSSALDSPKDLARAFLYSGLAEYHHSAGHEKAPILRACVADARAAQRRESDPRWHALSGVPGYLAVSLLIAAGQLDEAEQLADEARKSVELNGLNALSQATINIAAAKCDLARARLHWENSGGADTKESTARLNRGLHLVSEAITTLAQCQQPHFRAEALLVKLSIYAMLCLSDNVDSSATLMRAAQMIEDTGLSLYLADVALEAARWSALVGETSRAEKLVQEWRSATVCERQVARFDRLQMLLENKADRSALAFDAS